MVPYGWLQVSNCSIRPTRRDKIGSNSVFFVRIKVSLHRRCKLYLYLPANLKITILLNLPIKLRFQLKISCWCKAHMNKEINNCEKKCCYFSVLSPKQKALNRKARHIILKGEEFAGSLNTLCGSCVRTEIINFCLDRQIRELLNCEG